MKIRDIYSNRIDRKINPAVVVSNRSPEIIQTEIEEYIFTDEIIENLYKLLNTAFNASGQKTGIWLNGYYGSGKSHFIKFVHYCLNPETSEHAFEQYLAAVERYDSTRVGAVDEITVSNINLIRRRITAVAAENILFNVEDETDDGSGEKLTRIFLNMLNRHCGYNSDDIPLAILFEKQLDRKGVFTEFKKLIHDEMGYDWDLEAAKIASFSLDSVLEIGKRLIPELDVKSLHPKLSDPDTYKVSIAGTLIPELKDYLKSKEAGFRLLFIVDEISQYIRKNGEILLNFQNIIERISEDLNNKVWVVCTAQQTLDDVTSLNTTPGNETKTEFGKILGRFDTRISLQSNDASFITQKRVLDKNSDGIKALKDLYSQNQEYIQNQFKIRHELYKGYESEDEFIMAYPFVPYQLKLIAHVFEAFQQLKYVIEEVKDNERSVLGITHFTANKNADIEIGAFMPFDAFFNEQMNTNMTHRGLRAIENAMQMSYVKENPFANRVVRCLFMLSNLLQNQKLTFPSTIDNLTVLMMTELDQNRMALQTKIMEVLAVLSEGNIIREEKGSFFFFNEDEIDVQNLIKSQTLGLDERLTAFDGFFRKMTGLRNSFTFGNNDFKLGYWIDDKEIFRKSDFRVQVLLYDYTNLDLKTIDNSVTDLILAFNEPFHKEQNLKADFDWFCKTQKFFLNNADAATGERAKTIENFRIRNEMLESRIKNRFEKIFPTIRLVSGFHIMDSNIINGTTPPERMKNMIGKHLSLLYKHENLSHQYARTQAELKAKAVLRQEMMPMLSAAEEMVENFITLHGDEMNMEDMIHNFEKHPFGWRPEALLDVLVHLVKKKKREFSYRNKTRFDIVEFINKALITSERSVCVVKKGEEIDQATLDIAVGHFREIFNQDIPEANEANNLYETMQIYLKKYVADYTALEEELFHTYPFGLVFHELMKILNKWVALRDPKALFEILQLEKNETKKTFDKAKGMADFAKKYIKDYDAIKLFMDANRDNISVLSPEVQQKAETVFDVLHQEDPRTDFRHAMKAWEELKKALKDLIADLKAYVLNLYENIFLELEAELNKNKILEQNIIADKTSFLSKINATKSVSQIKNLQLDASNFKSSQIQTILNYVSRLNEKTTGTRTGEPEILYLTGISSTIANKEEMEVYLKKVRLEMITLLDQNKIIILK